MEYKGILKDQVTELSLLKSGIMVPVFHFAQ